MVTLVDLRSGRVKASDFLHPSRLASHTILNTGGEQVTLAPEFQSQLGGHVAMSSRDAARAHRAFLSWHPDQAAWGLVRVQFQKQLRTPLCVVDSMSLFLDSPSDRKQELLSILRCGYPFDRRRCLSNTPWLFVLRIVASFSAQCQLPPFREDMVAVACGLVENDLDEAGMVTDIRDCLVKRFGEVYWLGVQDGPRGCPLVSSILGRSSDGTWYFYKDAAPRETDTKYPRLCQNDDGIGSTRIYGGSFHRQYVAIASESLPTLFESMDRRDVGLIFQGGPDTLHQWERIGAACLLCSKVGDIYCQSEYYKHCMKLGLPHRYDLREDVVGALRSFSAALPLISRMLPTYLDQVPEGLIEKVSELSFIMSSGTHCMGVELSLVEELVADITLLLLEPPRSGCVCLSSLYILHDTLRSNSPRSTDISVIGSSEEIVRQLQEGKLNPLQHPFVLDVVKFCGRLYVIDVSKLQCLQEYYGKRQGSPLVKVQIYPLIYQGMHMVNSDDRFEFGFIQRFADKLKTGNTDSELVIGETFCE